MQPIVVTLATMFILQGVTLLVMDKPGGQVSPALGDLLIGDAIPNLLPKPVLLIVVVLALWAWLKRTNFGVAIYAVGSDVESARAVGVPTRFVAIHGLCDRRRLLRPRRRASSARRPGRAIR